MTGRFESPEIEGLLTLIEGHLVFSVLKQTVTDDLKLNIAGSFHFGAFVSEIKRASDQSPENTAARSKVDPCPNTQKKMTNLTETEGSSSFCQDGIKPKGRLKPKTEFDTKIVF